VVAGQLARRVRVQDNVVRGAMQGIKLALSRSEAIEEQKALPIEDAALVGNRIVLGGKESEENAKRFGIMVGHALSLLVQDNGVDGSAMEASGLRLYGEYGLRLIVRDNHFTRLAAPIEIEVTGELPQKTACLWLVSSNIAQDAELLIVAKKEVMAVLRAGDNNVPRVT